MQYLERLEKWIVSALAEKPVGEPVAVRAFYQITSDHGLLLPVLAEATSMAGAWFASVPLRLYALGGPEAGYLSVLAEYARGQTAMLTVEELQQGSPSVSLFLIGNHGTLRYEDSPDLQERELSRISWKQPLISALQRSLRTGQPVGLENSGG